MKKILMLASVSSMLDQFNMPNIKLLQDLGCQVDVACNFETGNTSSLERVEDFKRELVEANVNYYQIDFARNILRVDENFKAYRQLKVLVEREKYSFIHCHSPIGGVLTRLVARSTNTKVIYTAHGFHFYKGAPLINWFVYYPAEKFFSKYTNVLITINEEDYSLAKKKFHAKKILYTPGIGIDRKKFGADAIDRELKRKELGLKKNEVMLLSVGELIKRKNHRIVIAALAKLENKNVKYYICGRGDQRDQLYQLAQNYGVEDKVVFLGFRTDVSEIYRAADIFVFPSLQEGLPVALMEAISAGLPIIASKIRGNTDLIVHGKGGYLVDPHDEDGYINNINTILQNREQMSVLGSFNQEYIKKFELTNVQKIMKDIYVQALEE